MATRERTGMRAVNRSRRSVIKDGLAGLVAAGAGGTSFAQAQTKTPASGATSPSNTRAAGPLFFDVETSYGVVRGMANTGIKVFRGIPYGADTSGGTASCLHASRRPGRAPALRWDTGPISPQTPSGYRSDYSQLIMWDRHVGCGGMGEDCLSLNVYTPVSTTAASARCSSRLHGGGWATGSANAPMATAVNSPCSETSSS
jgi:para-nitrobenzyl esterase